MSARAPRSRAGFVRRTISIPLVLALAPAAWAQGAAPPCRFEPIGSGTLARVIDARTFALADGREVRLAGIEIPPVSAADEAASARANLAAKAALESLLSGSEVVLKRLGPQSDRYGRIQAQVFTASEGHERWIQAELVGSGHASVSPRLERACLEELLARERAARKGKLGLWAEQVYGMARAEDHAAVAARRGRFTLVEGKVLSVRESGGTIYVNFGRRWSEDFTVTIAKRNERAFTAAGVEPKKLQGRVIRIRGWIEERGGPWIDAVKPEQIEVVETK